MNKQDNRSPLPALARINGVMEPVASIMPLSSNREAMLFSPPISPPASSVCDIPTDSLSSNFPLFSTVGEIISPADSHYTDAVDPVNNSGSSQHAHNEEGPGINAGSEFIDVPSRLLNWYDLKKLSSQIFDNAAHVNLC